MKKSVFISALIAAAMAWPVTANAAVGNLLAIKGFSYIGETESASVRAADDDPVLLTINGVPVTRSEFEYSYNKNSNIEGAVEQKSVEEYVEMFVNYKLKVMAALDARLDTLSSFRQEFTANRDVQLTPYLVDTAYIDSVAYSYYDRTVKLLDGKEMLRPAHILVLIPQQATEAQKEEAKLRADSIYNALKAGADFEDLAKRLSQDPGSARNGGLLPWIGPGSTVKEFEEAAYKLQVGEYSAPVESPFGFHIIKMTERKALEPYSVLRGNIIASLKRQHIEETSAENRIQRIVAASGGRLQREDVIDSVLNAVSANNVELKYLVKEYHDGLLFYEISKQHIWDAAAADADGLAALYKSNKNKYKWTEPRFKGFLIHATNKSALKKAIKVLKKNANGDWRAAIKQEVNKDSMQVLVKGPYLAKKGENAYIDEVVFKQEDVKPLPNLPFHGVSGKLLKQPSSYEDVRSLVVNDFQEILEKRWIDELRAKYAVVIDQKVLETVNKH